MLGYLDCDPVEIIPISTLPVLPDWVRNRNLENIVDRSNVATNVRVVRPEPGRQEWKDNRIPEGGKKKRIIHMLNLRISFRLIVILTTIP